MVRQVERAPLHCEGIVDHLHTAEIPSGLFDLFKRFTCLEVDTSHHATTVAAIGTVKRTIHHDHATMVILHIGREVNFLCFKLTVAVLLEFDGSIGGRSEDKPILVDRCRAVGRPFHGLAGVQPASSILRRQAAATRQRLPVRLAQSIRESSLGLCRLLSCPLKCIGCGVCPRSDCS